MHIRAFGFSAVWRNALFAHDLVIDLTPALRPGSLRGPEGLTPCRFHNRQPSRSFQQLSEEVIQPTSALQSPAEELCLPNHWRADL